MAQAMAEPEETESRFKRYTEEELKGLEDARQSKATKNNTKWGVKMFQEWSRQVDGYAVDMSTINEGDLCVKLRQFYAEATPKISKKTQAAESRPAEYHKNTLINVRAAINRHLHDIGRSNIDIVRGRAFKKANNMLDAKLKSNVRNGMSRPTQHKAIISEDDFKKINTYLAGDNPVLLRYRVWLNLAIHFVSRGLEFHIQLAPNSFKFLRDENDREYVVIVHETTHTKKQGGLGNTEAPCSDKRMYATQDDQCPVKALHKFLSKTDTRAQSLFNNCINEAMTSPQTQEIWYSINAVKQYQFSRFMRDISRNAKCTNQYTAHCRRATAIQAMSDADFELRHIMFMSGHRNESSVRSYSRGCTTGQKHKLSAALSSVMQTNTCREVVPATHTVAQSDPCQGRIQETLKGGAEVNNVLPKAAPEGAKRREGEGVGGVYPLPLVGVWVASPRKISDFVMHLVGSAAS